MKSNILSKTEALSVLRTDDNNLFSILEQAYLLRQKHFGKKVQLQVLTNAKSGLCSQDCSYCAQSKASTSEIKKHALIDGNPLLHDAQKAVEIGAKRYCIGLSGISIDDTECKTLCNAIKVIKQKTHIPLCCSIGFLTKEQATQLKDAGLDRINHNLNTSKRFYPNICTTHTLDERMENIKRCKSVGLEICSGGIIGLGEQPEDVVEMLFTLKELDPASIPINFLVPIKGTCLGNKKNNLSPEYCLRVLCLTRLMFPDKDIRAAGGREYNLRSLQPLSLYVVNSIFVSGYLTIGGQSMEDAIKMINDAGFDVELS